jgi:hypothetical protein
VRIWKRISEYWQEEIAHQRLAEFLNPGKFDLKRVNGERFNQLLPLALKPLRNQDVLSQ